MRTLTRATTLLLLAVAGALEAQAPSFTPDRASGIYRVGEEVGWTASGGRGRYNYTVRRDGGEVLSQGVLDLTAGSGRIETTLDRPAMVLVEVRPEAPDSLFGNTSTGGRGRVLLGAAVDPTAIQPSEPEPADFDAFWAQKIEELNRIPMGAVETPGESGVEGVEYAKIRLNNIRGARVYAQLAKPAGAGKFPALVVYQWAGVYPLQKSWAVDRAKEGWLVLNVMPHDLPFDMPQEFFAALPAMIRRYNEIGAHSRDESWFLQMYLGDYRAIEYLAGRPEWDGRTLVVTGTSMGGQQSFAMAGLNPRVTGLVVHVPAGADANAALHGRGASYPNWNVQRPEVVETARYFDVINFADRITARSLVSMGFIDEVTRPTGVWATFNRLTGPKEAVPLPEAAHNHQATQEQQRAYQERAEEVLRGMRNGEW